MGSTRLEMLKERLAEYYAAEKRILKAQSYTLGSRQKTNASLAAVQDKIKELEAEIDAIEATGSSKRRSARIIPLG